jgi:hypothetical protein
LTEWCWACKIKIVSDMGNVFQREESDAVLAYTTNREFLTTDGHDLMIGPMSNMHNRVYAGHRYHLPGAVPVIASSPNRAHGLGFPQETEID